MKGTVKQTTYEGYERLIRLHLLPALGSIKLKALAPAHVRALYREKLDSRLCATSVQRVHALLHKALKQAVNDSLLPRNVTEAVKAPRQSRKEIQPLEPETGTCVPAGHSWGQAGGFVPLGDPHRVATERASGPQVGRRRPGG